MNVKIDWLSFTLDTPKRIGFDLEALTASIKEQLYHLDAPALFPLFEGFGWSVESGRKPYPFRWQRDDGGVSVFFGQKNNTILFEIGGKGCDWLVQSELMEDLLLLVKERLTRLDIAADFRCETTPAEFVAERTSKRQKTTSEFNSPTGATHYIGSRSSEMYARVYRYNKPHPRHALLRVEHVLKRKEARQAAELIVTEGLEEVCGMVGNRFGWAHDHWKEAEFSAEPLPSVEREHGMKSTVFWLHSQVLPAIKRVTADGTLDTLQWVREYLLPECFPDREFDITSKPRDNG